MPRLSACIRAESPGDIPYLAEFGIPYPKFSFISYKHRWWNYLLVFPSTRHITYVTKRRYYFCRAPRKYPTKIVLQGELQDLKITINVPSVIATAFDKKSGYGFIILGQEPVVQLRQFIEQNRTD